MVLFGERYPIKRHADVLPKLTEVLYERDPDGFSRLLELRGTKNAYVSRDPDEMFGPRRVGISSYYVAVSLSATDTWKRARLFLRHLGYVDSDIEAVYD